MTKRKARTSQFRPASLYHCAKYKPRTSFSLCHEYGIGSRWRNAQSTANKRADETKADVIAAFIAPKDEKSKAVPQNKVEEKELVPAG